MITGTALASVALFFGVFWLLGISRVAVGALGIARDAVSAMRDPNMDDEARETAAQRASVRLIGAFLSILVRSALALLVSFLPIWLASSLGLARSEDVIGYLSRWDVIAILSLVLIAGYLLWMRLWPSR